MRKPPRVVRALRREGRWLHRGPTGEVGTIHRQSSFEVVWVRKEREAIDPRWFEMSVVDVLVVVQGRLRVDFEDQKWRSRVLGPGDALVLPPGTKCRAYRWPRRSRRATIFVAIYPKGRVGRARGRGHSD